MHHPPPTHSTLHGIPLHRLPTNRIIPQTSYSPDAQVTPTPPNPKYHGPCKTLAYTGVHTYVHTYTRTYVFLAATLCALACALPMNDAQPHPAANHWTTTFYTASLRASKTKQSKDILQCWETHTPISTIHTKKGAGKKFVYVCNVEQSFWSCGLATPCISAVNTCEDNEGREVISCKMQVGNVTGMILISVLKSILLCFVKSAKKKRERER